MPVMEQCASCAQRGRVHNVPVKYESEVGRVSQRDAQVQLNLQDSQVKALIRQGNYYENPKQW